MAYSSCESKSSELSWTISEYKKTGNRLFGRVLGANAPPPRLTIVSAREKRPFTFGPTNSSTITKTSGRIISPSSATFIGRDFPTTGGRKRFWTASSGNHGKKTPEPGFWFPRKSRPRLKRTAIQNTSHPSLPGYGKPRNKDSLFLFVLKNGEMPVITVLCSKQPRDRVEANSHLKK